MRKNLYTNTSQTIYGLGITKKESNHQKKKKRKKSFKMKFKKTKQKNSKLPGTGSAPSLGPRFHDTMLNPQSCRKIAMKLRANLSQFVSSQQRNVGIKCANILREKVFWLQDDIRTKTLLFASSIIFKFRCTLLLNLKVWEKGEIDTKWIKKHWLMYLNEKNNLKLWQYTVTYKSMLYKIHWKLCNVAYF